jgi:Holliday junction resolvase
MTSPQKRKGHAAELAVVKWLRKYGIKADRIQAGTHADKGDISGLFGVVIEVKDRKAHSWHGYFEQLRTQMRNADAYTGVIIAKRPGITDVNEWMAVMPAIEWLALVQLLDEAAEKLKENNL